jgi:unsaturated rhamnogalacturonyl hydrolase
VHYTWNDRSNGGFSLMGHLFEKYRAQITTLAAAPRKENLRGSDVYIIVDPDTEKETGKPNYVSDTDADALYAWVKDGGVLVLMSNDSGNSEFQHFNKMASRFGIQFNETSRNQVKGSQFEQGTVQLPAGNEIFKQGRKAYIKELATIQAGKPARPVVTNNDGTIIAVAKVGKGTVFAVGDPWLYNEYVDGRKLPAAFQNYAAAEDLVQWLLKQAK